MYSKNISDSIPLRRSRFSFSGISLATSEPKRFFVSITIPGFLYSFESTLTKSQLYRYSEFQEVVSVEHGIFPYVPELDQARGTHKRSQIWKSFINSHLSELV